ncbi:MAG: beta-ketoacyl synthase N-terminal-like domain-containing protein [Pseudomonadota bacterium]
MNPPRVFIKGTGILCALGRNGVETLTALEQGRSGLRPLTRFTPFHVPPLPVGEIPDLLTDGAYPVTHVLARMAADQAMAACDEAPDAIVLGVTTGGMAVTEDLLKAGCRDPERFGYHAIGSVAIDLAHRYRCSGPLITVSTACSSGGGAIALALAMIRSGRFSRVLAGGADSLCRLTYYGFKSLQLIDPEGARPLDRDRAGMSVAEGAGMLLLEAGDENMPGMEILGAGLSCDAHHPAQPHPGGRGALSAMSAALRDAGVLPHEIDYINLHGTGTTDNDRSEAIAVKALFGENPPPLSSIKGATGHSLGAAGAIEAVIATLAIERGLLPANTGCTTPDAALGLTPVLAPTRRPIHTVLSNSFGFGGNNAAIIIGLAPGGSRKRSAVTPADVPFTVAGLATLTGAGHTEITLDRLGRELCCSGILAGETLCEGLPPGQIRRVKRLSRIALALSEAVRKGSGDVSPDAVFFGTGWGCLSETQDFLQSLFETGEKFSSPTDFIGSVHNAPAGQIALATRAEGVNMTLSGGDYAFEEALFAAQMLITDETTVLVLGADEGHQTLSPLFDPSVTPERPLSDGGGALLLTRDRISSGAAVDLKYFKTGMGIIPGSHAGPVDLVNRLGGPGAINKRYGIILAGIPAAGRPLGTAQLNRILELTGFTGKVIDYRRLTGEFAAAAAVATVFAASLVQNGHALFLNPAVPGAVLVLGLGTTLTAIEVAAA